LTSDDNKKLQVRTPGALPAIADVLAELDDAGGVPYLGVEGDAEIPDDVVDAAIRADAAAKRTACRPEQRLALDRLTEQLRAARDPAALLRTADVLGRMLTLRGEGVSVIVVLTALAEGILRPEYYETLEDAYEEAHVTSRKCLRDLVRSGDLVQPTFDSDEYGRMAEYVQRRVPATLMAVDERTFFADDRPITTAQINAVIHNFLAQCRIWERGRKVWVDISNHLIAEVRGAMARKWPRLPPAGPVPDVAARPQLAISSDARSPVVAFAEERLVLASEEWTSSDALWSAWVAWCETRGVPPGDRKGFFVRLNEWGGDRIRSARPMVSGKQAKGVLRGAAAVGRPVKGGAR
jgi:hypothetical protein